MLSFFLFSCKKNEGSDSQTQLEGKWIYSKEGEIINGQELLVDYQHSECGKDFMEFKSNGQGTSGAFFKSLTCNEDIQSFTWSRKNNTITITIEGETESEDILSLTQTQLKTKDNEGNISVFSKI